MFLAAGIALAAVACAPVDAQTAPGVSTPSISVPSASQAPTAASPTAPPIRIYQEPRFKGGGASMSKGDDRLYAFVQAHPTVFSGAWFSSDLKQFVVGVARPEDQAAVQLEELRKSLDPDKTATKTVPAKYSWARLVEIQREIVTAHMALAQGGVRGVGPDPVNEAVLVTILRTDKHPVLLKNATVVGLAAKYGDAVEFEETSSHASADRVRLPDWHYFGLK